MMEQEPRKTRRIPLLVALCGALAACDVSRTVDVVVDVSTDDGVSIDAPSVDSGLDVASDVPRDVVAPLDVLPDGARSSGSCNYAGRAVCQDLEGYTAIASYMMACTSTGGTWSADPCARAGALGGCSRVGRDGSRSILWSYVVDADVASAESACVAAMGTWVSP